jgi:hypothetical protein
MKYPKLFFVMMKVKMTQTFFPRINFIFMTPRNLKKFFRHDDQLIVNELSRAYKF